MTDCAMLATQLNEGAVRSVPDLVAARKSSGQADAFVEAVQSLRAQDTRALRQRLATVEDSLLLWVLHLELDKRGVPPCLRGPRRDESPQLLFVTWLADVYHLAKRNPAHRPYYTRWRGLFENAVASDRWHSVAIWVYRAGHAVGHYHAKGLGLSDADRQPLVTMPTDPMRRNAETLKRLPAIRDRLWLHASQHRDRSGTYTTDQIADRRVELLRVFLLAGRSLTRACDYYRLLWGKSLSRQALTRQLEAIELATGMRTLVPG
jgi:hypothetical protein